MKGMLKVYFMPNYRVSLAERIFPAADVSEQISTAGTEASGTGNMKFMCNGALTLGTLDGANIEILEETGEDNMFIFGLTADEVSSLRKNYNPEVLIRENEDIQEALDLLFSGHFNIHEPGIFDPIRKILLEKGDYYMHIADLPSYIKAQEKVEKAYRDQKSWSKMAILNIANSGKFSSDRTIREYAREIWKVTPCEVEFNRDPTNTIEEARAENQGNNK
jgi:starch phosphorylase